jgi:hypothetical protein
VKRRERGEGELDLLTRGEKKRAPRKITGGSPEGSSSRRRGRTDRQRTESREHRGRREPLARSRAGGDFLKRDMGAPDSLQCLSGAHQIAHSSCPVNHRIAHRKGSSCARAADAPDSAQCSVRCTPDCSVSPDRRKILNFLISLSSFQPNQFPTYNHTK